MTEKNKDLCKVPGHHEPHGYTPFLFFVSLFVSIFVPSSSVSTLTIDDVTSKLRPTWLSYGCIHLLIMFLMFFYFQNWCQNSSYLYLFKNTSGLYNILSSFRLTTIPFIPPHQTTLLLNILT